MSQPHPQQPTQSPKQPQPTPNPQQKNPSPQQQKPSPQNQSHSNEYTSSISESNSNDSQSRSSSPLSQIKVDIQHHIEETKKQNVQHLVQKKIRYKYCCKLCKHTDASKKACVCVVPKSQRRTQIGQQGCQTCSCNGCSKQDFLSRGQDPQYKPGQKKYKRHNNHKDTITNIEFEARNGCCRKCMKAFSKSNKSCLCQVPEDVRNTKLPLTGCKICGCYGCNPQDKKDPRNRKPSRKQKQISRSRQKYKKYLKSNSDDSHSRQYIDPISMNFYNIEKSVIGGMIINQYRIDPAIFGFGIPQRTHNYIIGKPK